MYNIENLKMLSNSNFRNGLLESIRTLASIKLRMTVVVVVVLMMIIFRSKLGSCIINLCIRPNSKRVYLLEFACYKPNESQSVTKESALEVIRAICNASEDSLHFCKMVIDNSGLGQSTYLPSGALTSPPNACLAESRKEAQTAIFSAVEELLMKTGVAPNQVGILVVNCSIFNPAPSLSSMLVNRFRMREDVKTFNLSGMGCSASLASISLANQLLQVNENEYALVVSTESIVENGYKGQRRDMLLINCVFRVGGAAILLSNRRSSASRAKYLLSHTIRTHTAGTNPSSYSSVYQEEDAEGHRGVSVGRHLLVSANKAIRINLTTLVPLVLPLKAKLMYLVSKLARRRDYSPNIKLAFDHFFPHVGGMPVLDELARALKLDDVDMEPSRMTFYRFGNTSSSSVWYEMAYAEAKGRVKRGDRVCQLAFGSGFKCVSVVWKAVRSVDYKEVGNPWTDEIDQFPVVVDATASGYKKDDAQFSFHSVQ